MNFFFFLQKPGTLPIAIPIVLFRERDTHRFSLFDMGLSQIHAVYDTHM